MTEMRVLTVRQPWAWAIIHGGKDVENRVRNLAGDYRGPVAIHAGLAYDSAWSSRALDDAMRASGEHTRPLPSLAAWRRNGGAIIGVVDLVDVHLDTDHEHDAGMPSACRCRSSWAEAGAYHLVLANPRPLVDPIPFKGALGLRRLDDATRILIESQVGA